MNRQQLNMVVAVCFGMVVGPLLGPRIGDSIATLGDHAFWEILPWLLVAAIWVFLLRRIKRVPPLA